jgi:hypothetical protein
VTNVPGSSTLALSCTGDSNHSPWTGTGSITINPATPTLTLICNSVTTNGSPQACAPGGTATGIGGASVAGTFSYTYNGSATIPSAAATYTVVATFASGNSNYVSDGTASGSFVIGAQPGVRVTLVCTPVTFDSNAHGCTATPTPAEASCTGLVSETNAGSYPESVTCTDAGYTSGSATGTLVINPAPPTLSVSCAGGAYNGTAYSCTGSATGVGGAGVSGSFAFAPGSETNVGSYPETGTFTSTDPNYASGGTATGTLVINQATPVLAISCPDVTYDGNPHSCTASATGVVSSGSANTKVRKLIQIVELGPAVSGTFSCVPASETNAGAYPVTCSFTSSDPSYVSGGTVSGSLVINPATPILSVSCTSVTADGNPQACSPGGSATGIGGAAVTGSWTYTYNGSSTVPSAAATYTVVGIFSSSNSNYVSGGTATGSFVIGTEPTVTVTLSCPTPTYDGAAHSCTATPTPGTASCSGLVSETNAGSYPESVTCSNAGYTSGSATGTLVINPATPTLSATCPGGVYNGTAYSCTSSATGVGGAAIPGSFNCVPGSETNAGSYTETCTFTCTNSNYVCGGTASGTLVITPATPTLSLTCNPVTANGSLQACSPGGSATGVGGAAIAGTWAYTYNGSSTVPSAPATYTVVGTFTCVNPNYTCGGTATGPFVISSQPTVTVTLSCPAATFDGTAHACTATPTPGTASCSGLVSETNAGSYPESVTCTNAGYTSGSATGTLVIGPATPTLSATCAGGVYNGTAYSCTGSATGVGGAAVTGSFAFAPGSETNAGSYPETGTFTSTNSNYVSGGTASATLVITAATPALSLTCNSVTANGSPQACSPGGSATGVGGAAVSGTWTYTYNGSATVPSAAATYTIVGTFTSSNSNYSGGGTASGSFVIGSEPAVTVTLSCPTPIYDGTAHACTATPTPGTASCTGLVSETNAGSYPESVTCTNAGYTSGSASGTLAISPAPPTLSATCAGGVYNGTAYSCTGSATGVGGTAVSGSFAFAPGSETNAGSYPEAGTFTSTDPNYVSGGTATATLVISDATQSPSVSCPGPLTYDGNAHSCTITGGVGTCTSASVTNVPGTSTLALSCTGDSNHSPWTGTGSITINPATPTLSVTCTGGVSNGTAYSCSGTALGIDGVTPVAGSFSFVPGSETAAGTYAETGTFTSADSNYVSGGTASGTLMVTPAVASNYIVSGQISLINGGGALSGATVSLGGGLTATTDPTGAFTITNVPAGTYTLTPSYTFPAGSDPADSAVFYPASQNLTVSGDLTGQSFTAELGYTVSGNATYDGSVFGNSSQLYVNMQNTACSSCSPNGTSLLFALPGPLPFTIHGVTPGTYNLQSWFDVAGYGSPNIGDPVSSANPVTVSAATGDVTTVSVTLNDPSSWATLTAPTMTVSPAIDKGAIVYYKAIMSGGVEQATRYNLCWSSITAGGGDSDCEVAHPTYGGALSLSNSDAFWENSGTGKIVILDGGDTSSIFYTKSQPSYRPADGSQYAFCLQGVNGDSVAGPWTCQHATLAAPPTSSTGGTSTLALSVKTPVKATGAVYAGCYDPVGNALYVAKDDSKPAAGTHSYTVYGIPSSVANCNVVAAMDENNDGFITPLDPDAGSLFGGTSGDIFNLGRNSTLTALTVGGTTTAPLLDLTPYAKNSSATLTTQNNLDPLGNQSYSVNFDVRPLMRLPVGVELTSGLNVLQTIDFAPGCTSCGQGEFNVTVSTANQAPSGSYTLSVFDESITATPTTDTPTLTVSNVVGDFATNLSATGGATPTFTWLYPVNNTTAYTYQFTLWDASGNVVSQVPATTGTGFPSTTPNSITPSVTLTSGATYTWAITTIDSNGNTAQQKATYQP